jgi:uncharacterized protein (DUF433 family)
MPDALRASDRFRSFHSVFMSALLDRVTVNPEQCSGRPCIRGMRIRVVDVLDLLAAGLTQQQSPSGITDLEAEDIACPPAARQRPTRSPDFFAA